MARLEEPAYVRELLTADGVTLFYRGWKATSSDLVLVIHGLGGHSGWYAELGDTLAAEGLNVIIPDLRGFGLSGGVRGHVRRGASLIDDLHQLATEAERDHATGRLHLVGHSMGAILAVHLANRLAAASLALINPWIEDDRRVPSSTVLRVAAGGIVGSRRTWALAAGAEEMTRDPGARAFLNQDTLWVRAETASFFTQMLWLRLSATRVATRLRSPALVVQTGGDTIVRHHGARQLFERLGSPEKEWAAITSCTHDFEFDAGRSLIYRRVGTWCLNHAIPSRL